MAEQRSAMDQRGEAFLRGLFEATVERARGLAPYFQDGFKGRHLSDDEINTAWNTRGMALEEEWELWRARKPNGEPMHTPEEIGLKVFPNRAKLAYSGGRIQPKEAIGWVNQQAERQRKRAEREMPEMLAPEPEVTDGLE